MSNFLDWLAGKKKEDEERKFNPEHGTSMPGSDTDLPLGLQGTGRGFGSEGNFNHMNQIAQLLQGGTGGLATLMGFNQGLLRPSSQRSYINQGLADQARAQNQSLLPVMQGLLAKQDAENSALSAQARKLNAEADATRKASHNTTFHNYGDEARRRERESLVFSQEMKDREIARRLKEAELRRMADARREMEYKMSLKETLLPKLLAMIGR